MRSRRTRTATAVVELSLVLLLCTVTAVVRLKGVWGFAYVGCPSLLRADSGPLSPAGRWLGDCRRRPRCQSGVGRISTATARTDTRWAATRSPSAAVAERRSTTTGSAAAATAAGGDAVGGEGAAVKGRAEEKPNGRPATNRGGGGGGGGRRKRGSRGGRKGQDGWRKKGDFAKKQDLLHQMKWPKTRRKALITMWESDLMLKPEEYSALLTAACQLGWAAMASTIMGEMIASGVPVTIATYDAAIKAACKANKDRLALLLIVDQYARWQAEKLGDKAAVLVEGIGDGAKAATAVGRGMVASGSGKGLNKSHFRTNLTKVLQVTSRNGDVEGSLEVLKYMSAMGISANPAVCQHLLTTACKAGRGHPARVPLVLRAMGESGLRPDLSLLDALEMLFEANSPEVALDLLVEVAKAGREKTGLGKLWRFETTTSAAEAFSFVIKRAEKIGRLDVVGMTIHALLSELPKSQCFGRAGLGAAAVTAAGKGEVEAVPVSAAAAAAAAAIRGETGEIGGGPVSIAVEADDEEDEEEEEEEEEEDEEDEDEEEEEEEEEACNTDAYDDDGVEDEGAEEDGGLSSTPLEGEISFDNAGVGVVDSVGAVAPAAGGGGGSLGTGGESASMLSSAVSGALTGARGAGGKGNQEEGEGGGVGGGGAVDGTEPEVQTKKKPWARLGQKELNRRRRSEAIYRQKQGVWVLNHILGDLANSSTSGHTAAGVLDRWRSITLGGEWMVGGDRRGAAGEEPGSGPAAAVLEEDAEVARYSRPTEASYKLTMSALVQSGQWGRARSLLEVMRADGVPPEVSCYSHLLTLLHTRLSSRLPEAHAEEESLSSVEDLLWSEPTLEWDEVVSLVKDARTAEDGEYEVTEDMYRTALSVVQIVSQRPMHVSLGVVGPAAPLSTMPPAKVFLERAESLLDWALDSGLDMSVELLLPLLTLSHKARDAPKVFKFFEEMLELDVPRQGRAYASTFAEAYNMALDACEFGEEPERALAYIRTMESASGLKPRAKQYEGAINAMVTSGRFRDAYQLLAEAVENGAEKVGVYDAAMRACAKEGNPAQAEILVRIMLEMGLNPGGEAMSQLLLAYGNAGDVDGIQSVMTRAGNEVFTGGVMNALVYESVLRVLAPLEAWQDAETFVKEGELVLPGSLTYRTYGYLMVAYAVEKQWGAAIELALGTGRWPEKTTGVPEGRFHPPELRETTCAVALKWLLTHGTDGAEGVAIRGRSDGKGRAGGRDGDGHGGEELQAEATAERALEYRRCGRELFTRLLASGAPLRSVRVIKAALGGVGAEPAGPSSPSEPLEGSEDAPIHWKQTMPFWGDPEQPLSAPPSSPSSPPSALTPSAAKKWNLAANDWLVSVLPEEDAEREVAAQALHLVAVVEVLLRSYSTSELPGANEFHSPAAVGLLQQAISAACAADDPDLADRLLTAWLDRVCMTQQPPQARLRSALRISLSEVLAAFFAEGQGEEGVYRGLSLIGRCRDVELPPYPFDFLSAMRACNTAGLYSTALRLFDQLTVASAPSPPPWSSSSSWPSLEYSERGGSEHREGTSKFVDDYEIDGSLSGATEPNLDMMINGVSPEKREAQERLPLQRSIHRADGTGDEEREAEVGLGAEPVPTREELVTGGGGGRNGDGNSSGDGDDRGRREMEGVGMAVEGAGGGQAVDGGSGMMAFGNLNDILDGDLIPAAAATIALESCFLGGRRDQAMEIVWQLIRQRHPLTEACRNRAIVALTSGGHPDMALDMARGMEKDRHYADRATVDFVERFQKRAFDAAKAYDMAQQGDVEDEEEDEYGDGAADGDDAADGEDEDEEDWEEEDEDDEGLSGEEVVSSSGKPTPRQEFTDRGDESPGGSNSSSGGGGSSSSGDRPSELVLRFLPLLSEALRSNLRPGEDELDSTRRSRVHNQEKGEIFPESKPWG